MNSISLELLNATRDLTLAVTPPARSGDSSFDDRLQQAAAIQTQSNPPAANAVSVKPPEPAAARQQSRGHEPAPAGSSGPSSAPRAGASSADSERSQGNEAQVSANPKRDDAGASASEDATGSATRPDSAAGKERDDAPVGQADEEKPAEELDEAALIDEAIAASAVAASAVAVPQGDAPTNEEPVAEDVPVHSELHAVGRKAAVEGAALLNVNARPPEHSQAADAGLAAGVEIASAEANSAANESVTVVTTHSESSSQQGDVLEFSTTDAPTGQPAPQVEATDAADPDSAHVLATQDAAAKPENANAASADVADAPGPAVDADASNGTAPSNSSGESESVDASNTRTASSRTNSTPRAANGNQSTTTSRPVSTTTAEAAAVAVSTQPPTEGAASPAQVTSAAAVSAGAAAVEAASQPGNSGQSGSGGTDSQGPNLAIERTAERTAARGTEAAATSDAPEAAGPSPGRLVDRVARAMAAANLRDGPVRLQLTPPELGSMRIEINVRDGAVEARLEVETQAARETLLENLPALRERLAQQNLKIETFEVSLAGQSFSGMQRQARDQQQQPDAGGWQLPSPARPRTEQPRSVASASVPVITASGLNVLV